MVYIIYTIIFYCIYKNRPTEVDKNLLYSPICKNKNIYLPIHFLTTIYIRLLRFTTPYFVTGIYRALEEFSYEYRYFIPSFIDFLPPLSSAPTSPTRGRAWDL